MYKYTYILVYQSHSTCTFKCYHTQHKNGIRICKSSYRTIHQCGESHLAII